MRPYEYKPHGSYKVAVRAGRCKAAVLSLGGFHDHQCLRKTWQDGWCKQHHPDTVAERERESEVRDKQKYAASPLGRMRRMSEKITALESALAEKDKQIRELRDSRTGGG